MGRANSSLDVRTPAIGETQETYEDLLHSQRSLRKLLMNVACGGSLFAGEGCRDGQR